MPKINNITLVIFLISFFTSNLKGQQHIEFFLDEQSSPYENYKKIIAFNKSNVELKTRSSYTHKVDSSYCKLYSDNYKTEYIFDNENSTEHTLGFKFDDNLQSYIPESNNVLTYNKNDLLIRQTYNLWDGEYDNLGEENPSVKRQYYYNENDQLIRTEEQGWNDIQLNIIPTVREYEYNAIEKLSAIKFLRWSEEDNTHKVTDVLEYTYNNTGQLDLIVSRATIPSITRPFFDSILIYYNEFNLIEREVHFKHESNGDINLDKEYEYIYDNNKNLMEDIYYDKYQKSQQKWFKESRTNYFYDSKGNLISTKHYNRTLDDFEWGFWQEIKYKHDDNLFPTSTQIPRSNVSNFNSDLTDNSQINVLSLYQEFNGEVDFPFDLNIQYEYFYSPTTTSTTDNIDSQYQLSVSPNPTSSFLKFEVENYSGYFYVSIVDTQGKVISQSKVSAGENIPVSDLDAGVYFYRVVIDNEIVGGKFVKVD